MEFGQYGTPCLWCGFHIHDVAMLIFVLIFVFSVMNMMFGGVYGWSFLFSDFIYHLIFECVGDTPRRRALF